MDGRHLLECLLDELLAEQLTEYLKDDAITDAEEEMEWGRDDALGIDGEEGGMLVVNDRQAIRSVRVGHRPPEQHHVKQSANVFWMTNNNCRCCCLIDCVRI